MKCVPSMNRTPYSFNALQFNDLRIDIISLSSPAYPRPPPKLIFSPPPSSIFSLPLMIFFPIPPSFSFPLSLRSRYSRSEGVYELRGRGYRGLHPPYQQQHQAGRGGQQQPRHTHNHTLQVLQDWPIPARHSGVGERHEGNPLWHWKIS